MHVRSSGSICSCAVQTLRAPAAIEQLLGDGLDDGPPRSDDGERAPVRRALQRDREPLELLLQAPHGRVRVPAHAHVPEQRRAAERRVQRRRAHQPVRQVARPRHLRIDPMPNITVVKLQFLSASVSAAYSYGSDRYGVASRISCYR